MVALAKLMTAVANIAVMVGEVTVAMDEVAGRGHSG